MPEHRSGRAVDRTLGVALSLIGHLVVVAGILLLRTAPPRPAETGAVTVDLIGPPTPFPSAAALAAPPAEPPPSEKAVEEPTPVKARTKPQPKKPPRRAPPAPAAANGPPQLRQVSEIGEGELVGAATAGGGAGGKECDMVRRLQAGLRGDSMVHRALQQVKLTPGKAVLVWNGTWVQHPGEDGEGLAGIREAMLMEIGFAPEACRAPPMHGMVLISLGDGPGAARIAFGAGQWRWGDLLRSRSGASPF